MQAQGITLGVWVSENGGHQGCFSGVDSHGGVNEILLKVTRGRGLDAEEVDALQVEG